MDTKTATRPRQQRRAHKTHLSRLRRLQDEVQALKLQLAQVQARQEAREKAEPPSQPHVAIPERNARLIALLDSFEQGDVDQQRQDFAALQAGVEEARPGQRQVFGEGFNP